MIFAIINESSAPELLQGSALVGMAANLQDAYDECFGPCWGVLPVDVWVGALADAQHRAKGEKVRIMHILDDIQGDDGMLADHYLDGQGRPTMELSVAACRRVHGNLLDVVSEALSHELFECTCNPFCRTYDEASPFVTGKKVAHEVCDPVQGSPWRQRDTLIANFVLPAWFDPTDLEGPFDYATKTKGQRILSHPFECYPAGYLIFDDGTQQFGEKLGFMRRAMLKAKRGRIA